MTALAEALLNSITLHEYLLSRPPRAVFSLPPTTTLSQALHQLSTRNILSAPILSPTGNYSGFIDVMDVASAIFERYPSPTSAPQLQELEEFLANTEVVSLPRANDALMVLRTHGSLSLLEVVQRGFLNPPTKLWCHRIAIFDAENPTNASSQGVEILDIISQSDILRFLHRHLATLPILSSCTLSELGFRKKSVFSVQHDVTAADAYQAMLGAGATACAVLKDGNLVANLSPSDLRGLAPSDWPILHRPVVQFLEYMSENVAAERAAVSSGGIAATYGVKPPTSISTECNSSGDCGIHKTSTSIAPPAVCTLEMPLRDVLNIITTRGVHRVYLVESLVESRNITGLPVGLVSLTDLLVAIVG